jgi:hypothetical protein
MRQWAVEVASEPFVILFETSDNFPDAGVLIGGLTYNICSTDASAQSAAVGR